MSGGIQKLREALEELEIECARRLAESRRKKRKKISFDSSGVLFCGCATEVVEEAVGGVLAFVDPPFNIGEEYEEFHDKDTGENHGLMMWAIQDAIARNLDRTDLSVAWHVPEKMALMILESARAVGFELHRQIVRTFGFGVFQKTNWINGHENLFVFRQNGGRPVWNPEEVLVDSTRLSMGDKRTAASEWKGRVPPSSSWPFARIQGNNRERFRKAPNQLPLKYLARLVLAHSNEGDLVFDGCCGSGSLWLVCKAAGRYYVGAEISEKTARSAVDRVNDKEQIDLAKAAVEWVRSGGKGES